MINVKNISSRVVVLYGATERDQVIIIPNDTKAVENFKNLTKFIDAGVLEIVNESVTNVKVKKRVQSDLSERDSIVAELKSLNINYSASATLDELKDLLAKHG